MKRQLKRGAWVAQSVKCSTFDFSSGHDLAVCEFEPCIGLCAHPLEPGGCFRFYVSLSLSLSLSLSASPRLSLKNK